MEVRLIIAGSRDFNDYELLEKEVDKFLFDLLFKSMENLDIEVVSGGARGADRLGEKYAKEGEIPIKVFEANWEKHKKSAGFIRNEEMAKYASHCICFDLGTPGTASMIRLAKKYKLGLKVVKVESINE